MIPALLYLIVIAIVGLICWFLAFFAVLFTGRWPAGLRGWVMKMVRVGIRFDGLRPVADRRVPAVQHRLTI